MVNTDDLAELERQCIRFGKRHSALSPDVLEDVLGGEPRISTEQMREWCWLGYRQARVLRGDF